MTPELTACCVFKQLWLLAIHNTCKKYSCIMSTKDGRIARKSGVHKRSRKTVGDMISEKSLPRSSSELDNGIITPPISARLRSANTQHKFVGSNMELTTDPLKQKARKSFARENKTEKCATYLDVIAESNGIPDVLSNHNSSNGFSSNGPENKISETTVLQPMTNSRFCSSM
ncbi:hypothetical protein MN116_003869 [Schistosoma mekongi]|uniref:Uncharacterized protein n=1 Tax=Schistosoma mekongi TaxID=38744 RepID=A0AAE1ZF18_SCHME|nr:hypothetical protein MN116_003869 [Schistosoma mekongi]